MGIYIPKYKKGVVLFNNWRDTHARTVQRINFRPEQGDSQAGDKVGDRKNDYAKHYYAGNYAAKAPFSFAQKPFAQHFAQQKPIYFG